MIRLWSVGLVTASLLVGGIGAPLSGAPPQAGKPITVVVDAGHGAQDRGAKTAEGVREKDINLALAKVLGEILSRSGIIVRMTRQGDTFVPLSQRSRAAAQQKADYFLSIHSEAQPEGKPPVGAIVFHHQQNEASRQLASVIAREAAHVVPGPATQVRSDTTLYAKGLTVLRNSPVPAVLVSLGDLSKLQDQAAQQRAANAIAAGLRRFIATSRETSAKQ